MKLNKIYSDIIKSCLKDGNILLGFYEEKVFVSTDGYLGYFIPKNEFLLNIDILLNGRNSSTIVDSFKESMKNSNEAHLTGDLKVIEDKKIKAVKIENSKTYAWVNEKYLVNFENATFKISSPISGVWVYEDEELVGLVMPVRVKD